MRRVSYHSPAAYLASAVSSALTHEVCRYLHHFVDLYNNLVDPPDSLTPDSVDNSCSSLTQKFLSNKIEDCQFRKLFDNSTPINRAHLLSISSPHASAWLSVTACTEAIQALSRLATRVSTRQGHPKSLVCNEIFGRLSLALMRANSRAILSRSL